MSQLATPTLARLYARQGHADKALAIYRQLLALHPERAELREEMRRLEPPGNPRGGGPPGGLNALDLEIRRLQSWLARLQDDRRKA